MGKYLIDINLKGKTAVVTGATKGIGRAAAIALHQVGANIIALGRNDKELTSLKKKLKKRIKTFSCDMNNYRKLKEIVYSQKRIDVLINNAGITRDNLSIRMKEEEWQKVIDINLTSTFLLSKNSIKKMLKSKKGKIINITSVVGHTGNIGQANYTASKAGVVAMSKSLALEYGKKNINVNCISPGFITTDMTDKINDEYKEILKSRIPLDRFGSPNDIANAVIFLSSELSDYITGETLHVNGGMYFS